MERLSIDNWELDACPHHGPSISIDDQEVFHTTWYTDGTVRQGAFYARSTDGGKTFNGIRPIGSGEDHTVAATSNGSDHPLLVSKDEHVYVSWLTETEGFSLISLEGK